MSPFDAGARFRNDIMENKKVPEQISSDKGCVIFNRFDPEPGEPELELQPQLTSPLLLVKPSSLDQKEPGSNPVRDVFLTRK